MGQGISYPLNDGPVDDDQLLGIDDPEGTWSIQRFPIGVLLAAIRDRLEALEIALRDNQMYPGEIVFTTNGQTFEPTIVLVNGSEATVEWTFSDGTTSSSLTPSIDFGSSAVRLQRLRVTPWSDLYRINVGYQREDGGHSTDEQGNTFEMVDAQPVTNIANLKLVQDTLVYLCGCHCPITSLNVRDFTALHTLEFYGCTSSLVSVDIYGTSNLRRACFENSYVGFLDFSASPLMEDVRGSTCHLTEIRWGTTGQYLWHMCVRENAAYLDPTTWPSMDQFPVLRDFWISGNGITGDLVANSTVVGSAWLYNNNFTSMDMSNTNMYTMNAYNNPNCTTITIDNCPGLTNLNASGCALTQANVDYILSTLDANGMYDGTVDLSGGTNSAPSATGLAAQASLESKGWTVTINGPAVPLLSSATIGPDGQTWTLVFDDIMTAGVGGNGGMVATMSGVGTVNLTYSSGDGSNTLVFTGDATVDNGETGTLAYTQPGDGLEDDAGNDLANFSGETVTNNSTQNMPPTLQTVSIDGTTWTLTFDMAVTAGAGGNGGFSATLDTAGAVALTYSSGLGTDTLVYTGDVSVGDGDSGTLDYVQPGNGIESNAGGIDLASITDMAITSAQNYFTFQTNGQAWGGHVVVGGGTVTWDFGDGTQFVGADPGTRDFGSVSLRTHKVTFSDPAAVTYIALIDDNPASVVGTLDLGDFPNLDFLHIFQCSVEQLDISTCPMLTQCHFLQNNWADEVGDKILSDLVANGMNSGIDSDLDLYIGDLHSGGAQQLDDIATLESRGWVVS